jgi:hypothetical protein
VAECNSLTAGRKVRADRAVKRLRYYLLGSALGWLERIDVIAKRGMLLSACRDSAASPNYETIIPAYPTTAWRSPPVSADVAYFIS